MVRKMKVRTVPDLVRAAEMLRSERRLLLPSQHVESEVFRFGKLDDYISHFLPISKPFRQYSYLSGSQRTLVVRTIKAVIYLKRISRLCGLLSSDLLLEIYHSIPFARFCPQQLIPWWQALV
jgi:hypothetical protein